ncbi:MAG TPA: PAS domain S-box protein [Ktedonobacteraceae bacterium]|jgi:PAS domain S-box-containing protein|nr:PAS domain S-box protein [Ktedonobacteraceae bacterium]
MHDPLAAQKNLQPSTAYSKNMQVWTENSPREGEQRFPVPLENSSEEEDTRQSLAAIVVSSYDAIISKTLDGIITSWNASAERMYGYTAEEVIGKSITVIFPLDRQDEFFQIMERIKKGERVEPYETKRLRKDGTLLDISVTVSPITDRSGTIVGASAIARDISEQKRMQVELRQAKQQLEVIFQHVADGITVQDTSGAIVYINDTGARRYGFSSAQEMLTLDKQALEQYLTRFIMKDEDDHLLPPAELPAFKVLQGEPHAERVIHYLDTQSGISSWALLKSTPIVDEHGNVQLAVNIFSDITEQKELEQHKDAFIGMASHELKTPLTSLKGFTQLLKRMFEKQGILEPLPYLTRMDSQLDKLTKLIKDLLDISKMQKEKLPLNIETLDLNELVSQTVEIMQAMIHTHHLHFESAAQPAAVGDRDRIGQVLINLLNNAVKYSPDADQVVVRVSADQEQAIVSVQDFGKGIAPVHHQKIFDRFYQISDDDDKPFSGLGIGLYISSQIIKQHHGRLWVESQKGSGATFYFALPLKGQKAALLTL